MKNVAPEVRLSPYTLDHINNKLDATVGYRINTPVSQVTSLVIFYQIMNRLHALIQEHNRD